MIVDGRAISDELIAQLKSERVRVGGSVTLGIVVSTNDPVIESFVALKTKVADMLDVTIVRRDVSDATTELVMEAVRAFKYDPAIDGIIVQLPMPETVDVNAVLSEVTDTKDVDGINPFTPEHARIAHAPVALAVHEILERTQTTIKGARVVVVGAGRLVGQPTAARLRELGADVTMFTLQEGRIEDLKDADIVVTGAGQPHFIKPEHVKDDVVLIDAGASESDNNILGDVDPSCAEKARVFTPVPGGVGPISVAMIFRNLLKLKGGR
jgi:methylenetetrahydrofolate dehydrogenase (NADP+) / methenyltetrahydrofolate cyclohydrolase